MQVPLPNLDDLDAIVIQRIPDDVEIFRLSLADLHTFAVKSGRIRDMRVTDIRAERRENVGDE